MKAVFVGISIGVGKESACYDTLGYLGSGDQYRRPTVNIRKVQLGFFASESRLIQRKGIELVVPKADSRAYG